jgi:GxxExxY protein
MEEHECATETESDDKTVKSKNLTSRFFKCRCTCTMSSEDVLQYVINAAQNALTQLGPHQSESVYEQSVSYFLYDAGLTCIRQVPVYESNCGRQILCGVADLEVQKSALIELKANYDRISDTFIQQIYRYKRAYMKNPICDGQLIFAVILFTKSGSLQLYRAND